MRSVSRHRGTASAVPPSSHIPSPSPPPPHTSPLPTPPPPSSSPLLLSGVYLACLTRGQQPLTGVSYFTSEDRTLHCGLLPSPAALHTLLSSLTLTAVLTPSVTSSPLLSSLSSDPLDPSHPYPLILCSPASFQPDTALLRLRLSLPLGAPGDLGLSRHLLAVRARIDVDEPLVMSAVGGLLTYLQGLGGEGVKVEGVEGIAADWVRVDRWTLRSLGVFREEGHPVGGRGKEGLSVFGALNRTVTGVGGKVLRRWLQWPTNDRVELERRLDAVELFTHAEMAETMKDICLHLKQLKDVPRLVTQFSISTPKAKDWKLLTTSVKNLLSVYELVDRLDSPVVSFADLADVQPQLQQLLRAIHELLDLDSAATQLAVRPGVNSNLDELRRNLAGLETFLSNLARSDRLREGELHNLSFKYVYAQQPGFYLMMEEVESHLIKRGSELTHMFTDHGRLFFKNWRTEQLDERYGDLETRIRDLEVRFVAGLQAKVASFTPQLLALSTRVYDLDGHIALAKAARDLGLTRPHLVDEARVQITGGRHLLHQLLHDSGERQFIPNDTALGEAGQNGGDIHLITGPNGSGKSVYVSQVALIAYMALCGSFVPAQSATVGLLDGIFSAFPTGDSSASSLSTFYQEASHAAFLHRHATSRSLCLLDEFGRGTDSSDGAALLTAYLTQWALHPASCPLVLATTHFHDILGLDLLPPAARARVRAYTMAYEQLTGDRGEEFPYITPLFQLMEGSCASSYALSCARSAGLDEELLRRMAGLQASFAAGEKVTAWTELGDECRREAESQRRVVMAFERLIDRGLETLEGSDVREFIGLMREEDEWISREVRAEAEAEGEQTAAGEAEHTSPTPTSRAA